jgi:hypothetical protein
MKKELTTARSRIYISSNLWILFNTLLIIGIIAYYLNKNLKVQNYLIRMRRVNRTYSNKNITKAIIPIL